MGGPKLRGPQPQRAMEKEHIAQCKSNVMLWPLGEHLQAHGTTQAELELGMATAAGGEKKYSAASARRRWAKENFGSLGVPSPDSCLILRSCMLRVSLSCVLLGDSPASKHMDGFLQESKNNK